MQLLFKKRRVYLNLIIGITWVLLVLSKFIIKEPINWFDFAMLVLALYYFTQYYFNYKFQYLTITDKEIVKQRIIYKKTIPIKNVRRFYRNKTGDYVIEGSKKKIKINPLEVQPESLIKFKHFTSRLKVAKDIF